LPLIQNFLIGLEKQLFFNEPKYDQDDFKLEPHQFFGECNVIPLEKDVDLLDIENIPNVPHPETMGNLNPPLLTYEVMMLVVSWYYQIYQDLIPFSHLWINKKILLINLLMYLLWLKILWRIMQI
jgi:hypothetical protein